MHTVSPLLSGWTLTADELSAAGEDSFSPPAFSLPGAQALLGFSDLLGDAQAGAPQEPAPAQSMPFALPAMLPDGAQGHAVLSRDVRFGALAGRHALLALDCACGLERITLDGEPLPLCEDAAGAYGAQATADLTDALRRGRTQRLSLHFSDSRPAGCPGGVFLRTAGDAQLCAVAACPSASPDVFDFRISVRADRAGRCTLQAACAAADAPGSDSPWRETAFDFTGAGEKELFFSMHVRAPRFAPGAPFSAPVLKLRLLFDGCLSDSASSMFGGPCAARSAFVPLTRAEYESDPEVVIAQAKALGVSALSLPAPACPWLYRRLTQEGVMLISAEDAYAPQDARMQIPCAAYLPASASPSPHPAQGAASIRALDGVVSVPRAAYVPESEDDILADLAGWRIDASSDSTQQAIARLRALLIRLRAEAARQGRYHGALTAPGEWRQPLAADALKTAFSPLHVSILPLRGAWWTCTRLSAQIMAFIPPAEQTGLYSVRAQLLCADGSILGEARADNANAPLPFDCPLPDAACMLTLRAQLLRSGAVVCTREIAVPVGERGALEAAF